MRCGTRTIAKSAPRNVFASVQSAAGLYMAEGWQAAGMGNRVAASDSTRLGCPAFCSKFDRRPRNRYPTVNSARVASTTQGGNHDGFGTIISRESHARHRGP